MIDGFAKEYLHEELQWAREALVWKLDGLPEYDVRRPLTATGTNLLGLVKHVATWEARYLGEIFDRPFPEPLPRWEDSDGSDLWVNDTTRHAGHADILREQLDGQTGVAAGQQEQIDTAAREAHCAKIEKAARAASRQLGEPPLL